jgi:hypothetical protein
MEVGRNWLKRLSDLPARTEEEERIDNYGMRMLLDDIRYELQEMRLKQVPKDF